MSSRASALMQPIRLGSLTLKNRVFMSALTRSRAVPTNVPNDLMLEYYKQRVGAGLIITEATLVSQQGTEWSHAPGIWNQGQVEAWKKITAGVHANGGVIFSQLWHAGRVSHPDMPEQVASGEPVYGPSPVAAKGGKFRLLPGIPGYVTPTEIDDPWKIVELFRRGARNAKEAGFDGVEIHGANGYLCHQFLDSTSNVRTDQWGGSIENRARFCLEVLKVVIEVWGADRVGVKLTPCGGYNDMGMPLQESIDTYSYFIKEAIKLDIAYVCLTRYLPPMDPAHRGTPHDVVETYGPLFTGTTTKVFANGGYTPEEAAGEVAGGKVEGVFFGTLYISHPDLAQRIQHGKALDNPANFKTFYGIPYGDIEVQREGYVDYPSAVYDE